MKEEQTPTRVNREHLDQLGYIPIAACTMGDSHYLIRQTKKGLLAFDQMHSVWDTQYFDQQKKLLPAGSVLSLPDVDTAQVTKAQISATTPTVSWHERTTGADEPTLTFRSMDVCSLQEVYLDMSERELVDLFLKEPNKKTSAGFFSLDTKAQELIGIALRRGETSTVLFVPPKEELGKLSATAGLVDVLDGIYQQLKSRPTDLQLEVDEAIFQASLSTKNQLQIDADSTPSGQKRGQVYQKIYQIQALLLALKAEGMGGKENPALVSHVPFLKDEGGKSGGISRWINVSSGPDKSKVVKVGVNTWTALVEPFQKGILTTKSPAKPTNTATVPSSPRVVYQPGVQESRPKQMTEKQKAIMQSRDVSASLQTLMKATASLKPEQVDIRTVNQFYQTLDTEMDKARVLAELRAGIRPTTPPGSFDIHLRNGFINVAGILDGDAYEFLTGNIEHGYQKKIDAAFSIWQSHVLPLYNQTSSRAERMLKSLKDNRALQRHLPSVSDVTSQLENILSRSNATRNSDVHAADLSYLLLSTQIVYALHEQYEQVKAKGESNDIDRWAKNTYGTLSRLRGLSGQMKGLIK